MSDAELVRAALAGERSASEQLVRRWSPRVLAVCHARVGRLDVAEDLAQEALLRGLRALATLADANKFGPWLCGIATRACLDWIKAQRRGTVSMSALDDDVVESAYVDAPDVTHHQDEVEQLMAEVERLPLPYREVLMHYYYDDCTYEELAQLLGVSAATINVRLTKARQLLRQRMTGTPPPSS